jgi:RHS repeat-associated protein
MLLTAPLMFAGLLWSPRASAQTAFYYCTYAQSGSVSGNGGTIVVTSTYVQGTGGSTSTTDCLPTALSCSSAATVGGVCPSGVLINQPITEQVLSQSPLTVQYTSDLTFAENGSCASVTWTFVDSAAIYTFSVTVPPNPSCAPGGGSGGGGSGSGPYAGKALGSGCSDTDTNSQGSQLGQCTGDPINNTNGNAYEVLTDYQGYGPFPLVFTRFYNSLGVVSGSLGKNWSHSYSASINPTSAMTVQAIRASQKTLTFNLVGGIWTPDPDVNARLIQQTNASGTTTGWVLTSGNDNVETYTASGLLASISTRSGLTQTLSYNGSGQLSTVTDPFGRTLAFTYDGSGRISTMRDPAGRVYSYSYDASNNLASIVWPDATAQRYVYENTALANALTGIFDEIGTRYATITYNAAGLATATTLANGVQNYSLTYNFAGNSTVSTDPLGHVTTFSYAPLFGVSHTGNVIEPLPGGSTAQNAWTYDANGNIASYADFNGNKTTYSYDLTRNLQLQLSRADGRVTNTTWHPTYRLPVSIVTGQLSDQRTYDANGNLLTRALSDTSIPYSRTWRYTYNAGGQPLTLTDPNGNVTTLTYDAQGDVISITDPLGHTTKATYDGEGKRLTTADPNGLITTYAYDARGRLISTVAGSEIQSYGFDAVGDLISVTWPGGYLIKNTYDGAHRLIGITDIFGNQIAYTLDAMSNRIGETHTNASGSAVYAHTWAYDVLNRVAQSTGAAGQTTTFTYDTNGNLLTASDPLGNLSRIAYDSINRPVRYVAADGGLTLEAYDQFDHVVGVTDPGSTTTTYSIDALGDTRATNSPDAGNSTATPDAIGNVTKRVDARGIPLQYSYDGMNRVVQIHRIDTLQLLNTYTYDQTDSAHTNGIGRLTSMTDPSGTTNWAYDANGHVISKSQTSGGSNLVTSYVYDPVSGNLQSMTLPSGAVVQYTWVNGQIASAVANVKKVTVPLVAGIQYEPFGGPQSWTLGNGESDGRSFDLDGRITSDGVDTSISYDAASRIVAVTLAGTGGSRSYSYDAVSRLTGLTSTDGAKPYGYLYDPAGNRVQQTVGKTVTDYGFAAGSNRLLNASTGKKLATYTYDADGSRTNEGTMSYAYDAFERMSTGTGPNGTKTDTYNGLGQRIIKSGTATTYFAYDEAGHLVGEYNKNGKPIEETLYLGDMPLIVIRPSGVYYVHTDYRNTPRQIENSQRIAVWSWDPRAFGDSNPIQNLAGTTFDYNLRFPGQYFDGEILKNYNYYRTYDPTVGRYLEPDPIALNGGTNIYAYVENSPALRTDSLGLLTWDDVAGFINTAGIAFVNGLEHAGAGVSDAFSFLGGLLTGTADAGPQNIVNGIAGVSVSGQTSYQNINACRLAGLCPLPSPASPSCTPSPTTIPSTWFHVEPSLLPASPTPSPSPTPIPSTWFHVEPALLPASPTPSPSPTPLSYRVAPFFTGY